jgi:hypothetical protein
LLDNIAVLPISCTNYDERDGDVQVILTPTCPRFFEDYKNDFSNRWKSIDPVETKDGPSNWTRLYGVEDREIVLAQKSGIRGISEFEDGSIFLLNKSAKVCTHGKFKVKFKATADGIVGLVFRYNEKGDFYILEISGKTDKFLRFRKRMGNLYQLISQKPLIGYNLDKWYSIILYMKGSKFNVYFTKSNIFENPEKMFDQDVEDTDLKIGMVGLSTYKTSAYFSEISLSPFDQIDEKDEMLYVDEESLDRKVLINFSPKEKIGLLCRKNQHEH